MKINQMTHLKERLFIGLTFVIFLIIIVSFSNYAFFIPLFALLSSALITVAVWEFYHMTGSMENVGTIGIVGTATYSLMLFLSMQSSKFQLLPELSLMIAGILLFLKFFIGGHNPLATISLAIFPFVYLTIPLSLIIVINYMFPVGSYQEGRWWLLYLITITKITDTGAYFIGKKFGKRPLAPFISPNKTWEGAFGGLFAALLFSLTIWYFTQVILLSADFHFSIGEAIILGLILSVMAQFGDLAESLLKRDIGVKDSNKIPGLGGVLDIVDSLVFTTPILYIYLSYQVT